MCAVRRGQNHVTVDWKRPCCACEALLVDLWHAASHADVNDKKQRVGLENSLTDTNYVLGAPACIRLGANNAQVTTCHTAAQTVDK